MSDVHTLEVLLHGEVIGTITHVPGDRNIFAFNEDYVNDSNRLTLSLGFKDEFGNILTNFRPTQTRLIPFFSNLLPEGHMREYLAERGGVNKEREFFLLWVLGQDLPGAVTVHPIDGERLPPETNAKIESQQDQAEKNLMRFSLAGVQLKFSAIQAARGGLTIPVTGMGGDWIVKLPSTQFDGVPENEFSMLHLASLIGIDVPDTRLIDLEKIEGLPKGMVTKDAKAFAIERFDRSPEGQPIHIEDFAQIFRVYPEKKYEGASYRPIAKVIAAEIGDEGIGDFVKRLTFNTLIGNADMHLKNWSLIYPDGRNAQLAPAYDYVSTISYIEDDESALKFSRTRRWDRFTEDELKHFAAKARISERHVLRAAKDTVEIFHQVWRQERKNLELTKKSIEAIDNHLRIIPLVTG